MKPYFARFSCGESQGVDAFSVSWRRGKGFFHPPVGLVSRVVRKAERERAEGLLVVPDWPGSGFMSVLEESEDEEGEIIKARIVRKRQTKKKEGWVMVMEKGKQLGTVAAIECIKKFINRKQGEEK